MREEKKKYVIIPSAKVVLPELQQIGKLPAIIYPFSKKIMLDHVLDRYQETADLFKIVCYENVGKVREVVKSYTRKEIQIVELPALGDLGYSILHGIHQEAAGEEQTLIINFADTLILDELPGNIEDSFYYSSQYYSDKWTFYEEENGRLKVIYDKKNNNVLETQKKNMFVGVFFITHPTKFKEYLQSAFNKSGLMDSFYAALTQYSRNYPMKPIRAERWVDTGHVEKYYDSDIEVQSREFNSIRVDKERGILRKESENKEKFIDEIKWYLKLPEAVEYVRPRIFSYSVDYENPYIEMEYYTYHTLHELFLYGDLTYEQWMKIFGHIKFICDDFSKFILKDDGVKLSLEDMYLSKTVTRLKQLEGKQEFQRFFSQNYKVNGKQYRPLNESLEILADEIRKRLCNADKMQIIHGDLCFSNILVDNNLSFVRLIDPRGRFGQYDLYGDVRYEMAKLLHSVDGKYDYIIKDMFQIDVNLEGMPELSLRIDERKRSYNLTDCFLECMREEIGESLDEISLIEALLFLSMIPLHAENPKRQLAMLATGSEKLGSCIKDVLV